MNCSLIPGHPLLVLVLVPEDQMRIGRRRFPLFLIMTRAWLSLPINSLCPQFLRRYVCVQSIVINLELGFTTDLITPNVQVRAPVIDEPVWHSNCSACFGIKERKTSFNLMKWLKHPPDNYKIKKNTVLGFIMLFSVHAQKSSEGTSETLTDSCAPQETQSNSELTRFGTKAWDVFKSIRWEV